MPESSDQQALNVVCLADVEPEKVSWLWPGYIPFGKVTVIEGDPGLGKSVLTLTIAAAVSGGPLLPGMPPCVASDVVLVTYEDGLADTLRPRLSAARADVNRIHAIETVPDGESDRIVQFPIDSGAVFTFVDQRGARLLEVDPLTASLSSQTDSYKDADVRRVLAPMAKMAEMTGCAVVVVRHLTKASSGRAVTAGGGSIGIAAAARSVLAVHQDPDAPDDPSARVLAVVKSNLAVRAPSLRFRIIGDEHGAAFIRWEGESNHSADGLAALRADAGEINSDREIDSWLRGALEDGPLDRKEIFRRGLEAGFSSRSMDRAATRIRVQRSQTGFGKEKRSVWALIIRANPANTANRANPLEAGADSPATIDTYGAIGIIGANGRNGTHRPRGHFEPSENGPVWVDEIARDYVADERSGMAL